MDQFPPERIRNLSIIAHIDHGKSTLADRLLQMTGTVPENSSPQFLDKLKVERDRGITVKAQTVSIVHTHTDGQKYLINLIDTPGHVDFSYEVSRSLGACEGGLLLVDCSQGIQAQTLSVFHVAQEANLKLLPVLNKVDLPHASPEETSAQIESTLGLPLDSHMRISAKKGLGVDEVLRRVIEDLPPPRKWKDQDGKLRGLVFDTFYDHFRGVVSLVRVFSGLVRKGDKIKLLQADRKYDVIEVGVYNPEEVPVDVLLEGQVGYVVCNMKNSEDAFIGDTMCLADKPVEPLPGSKPMKAMVYAGVFPIDSSEFGRLEEAIARLTLNDRSVSVQRESSAALSQGFRLGFLGTLHMDVFRQRLEDEYDSSVIITAPTVPYKVIYKDGREEYISNPAAFPDTTDPKCRVAGIEEPMVHSTIFAPTNYIGEMMDLASRYRGTQLEYKVLDNTDRALLRYSFPLAEIVTDFFSELKSASSGFASFDYEEAAYEQSDLVKLNILLNGKPVDALAMIVHRSAAPSIGRSWCKKLREVLPRQLFELAIQAAIGSRVIARETLSAMRKDVTAGLYGGHYDRKLKHLNKQKEGKRRLKRLAGNIDIPQSAFFDVLSSRPRAYTTMSRRVMQDDPILSLLPSVEASEVVSSIISPMRIPPPISGHVIAPLNRSLGLSAIHRLISDPNVSAEEIHEAYLDLHTSSHEGQPFTPSELRAIFHALSRTGRKSLYRRQQVERLHSITDELTELLGSSQDLGNGLALSILCSVRDRRKVSPAVLSRAEATFKSLFPQSPLPTDARSQEFVKSVNHLLYLCALAGDEKKFDYWSKIRESVSELDGDSWMVLSRLVLFRNTNQSNRIIPTVNDTLNQIEDPQDMMVIINYALWSSCLDENFEVVIKAYETLVPTTQLPFPHPHPHQGSKEINETYLSIPPDILPTRETFSLLINAFSYHGHLACALTVMRDMLAQEISPGVGEYMSLIRGFAKYVVIPNVEPGQARIGFPRWITHTDKGDITSIWERAISSRLNLNLDQSPFDFHSGKHPLFQQHPHNPLKVSKQIDSLESVPAESDSAVGEDMQERYDRSGGVMRRNGKKEKWTKDILEDIFEGLLALIPIKKGSRSLSPGQIYTVLLAFARSSNGDYQTVVSVWEALERKFNQDGWMGRREDGRLSKLRRVLGIGRSSES
ncbi:hypothetical protein TREMEDRAFT_73314 [Tremella mesenterica DSM 1558]|uniref:uncharacterized protein n=1 Tax=Tremella mesenterica (strain ATCC 24925 / CBS 8224 / DSM 1558 / NBRC 9311 / NRRL Y-6157 / RJB 2259-6 / UBC 559-6) TaxID=578456 RepID=UPI0003F4A454|nr:uncharacterized protein TREMEDRAFT_73314 [Tremella mesenterica DSM 1558]EIW71455.1 hypothetical protein TREMEDRAFT_73314 [Tremella mesenterica DSM 1558]